MDKYHLDMLQEAVQAILAPMEDGSKDTCTQDQALTIIDLTAQLRYWISEQYPKIF